MSLAHSSDQQVDLPASLFEIMTDLSRDAVIVIEQHGLVQYWNSAAETLFGYSQEEMLMQNMHDYITPASNREAAKLGFSRFTRTGQGPFINKTISLTAQNKSAEEFPVEINLHAVRYGPTWYAFAIIRNATEHQTIEDLKHQLDHQDDLTCLLDSQGFSLQVEQELTRAQRYGTQPFLLLIGLDHLKWINNTHGMEAGDLVLRAVADLLSKRQRQNDVLGRDIDDRFTLLLPDCPEEIAIKVAQNICDSISAINPLPQQLTQTITASIGIAPVNSQKPFPFSHKQSELALFQAKREGRNRIWLI